MSWISMCMMLSYADGYYKFNMWGYGHVSGLHRPSGYNPACIISPRLANVCDIISSARRDPIGLLLTFGVWSRSHQDVFQATILSLRVTMIPSDIFITLQQLFRDIFYVKYMIMDLFMKWFCMICSVWFYEIHYTSWHVSTRELVP